MKDKKTKIAIICVVALLLVLLGVTYAYWLVTKTQTNSNIISSACLDITLDNESEEINLTSQYPMSDEEGMKLTPYTFTVTNNCNTSVDYQVALESIGSEEDAIKASSLKVALDRKVGLLSNRAIVEPTISGTYIAHRLGYGTLSASASEGSSATHSLRIWVDEDAPISEMNKTFQSKISVTVGQDIVAPVFPQGTMAYDILVNNAEPTEEATNGLFKLVDDLGASYYYSGDVTNNYVQFGTYEAGSNIAGTTYNELTPLYWRIVRINGDGTIRLAYDGTEKLTNGVLYGQTGNHIVIAGDYGPYNSTDAYNVNYGDSNVKKIVDDWYSAHLEKNYDEYIADGIFCNDKEITSTTYYDENLNEIDDENAAMTSTTNYAAYDRLVVDTKPQLTCTRKEDRYTVDDIINGNGLLTHPIGLLTADEIILAGSYLYVEDFLWTLSPYGYGDYYGGAAMFAELAFNGFSYDPLSANHAARPVINLRADVEFTGDGSFETPYVIVTE